MEINDLKNTKESTKLMNVRLPKSDVEFLQKHGISFTMLVKKAIEELRISARK